MFESQSTPEWHGFSEGAERVDKCLYLLDHVSKLYVKKPTRRHKKDSAGIVLQKIPYEIRLSKMSSSLSM